MSSVLESAFDVIVIGVWLVTELIVCLLCCFVSLFCLFVLCRDCPSEGSRARDGWWPCGWDHTQRQRSVYSFAYSVKSVVQLCRILALCHYVRGWPICARVRSNAWKNNLRGDFYNYLSQILKKKRFVIFNNFLLFSGINFDRQYLTEFTVWYKSALWHKDWQNKALWFV